MIEWFTLGMQFVILIAVGWSGWSAVQTYKNTKRMTELIGQYRREIEWLTARIEALEGKANGRRERV
jgi:cell division protein FtsB